MRAVRPRTGALPATGLGSAGRRVGLDGLSAAARQARIPPSGAAAFSLWPFSRKTSPDTASPDAAAAAAAPPPPPPPSPTSSAVSSSPVSPTTPTASSSSVLPENATELSELLDGSALLDMPSDQIGYLHALGLDFGWGPTSMCQWLLEHIHVYTGLPWWGSIVAAAVLFRAAIFLPSLTAAEHSAKLQVLRRNPKYVGAMAEMQAQVAKGGSAARAKAMEARMTMKQMQTAVNVSTWRMFIPMINVPFGYGMFRLVRAMSVLPVPDLETAGLLWFTDLTVPDPFFILPIAGAVQMIWLARVRSSLPFPSPSRAHGTANPQYSSVFSTLRLISSS